MTSATIQQKELTKSDFIAFLEKGITYDQYKINMAEDHALNTDPQTKEYIHINQHRMKRVEKTYIPSAEILEQLNKLKHKIYWLILSEHWCGDASQTIPLMHAISEMSEGKIELKLVYRDENDDLMNSFLTNGARSVPKLIQLDTNYNVTGIWGPRPVVAQNLVMELKSTPATADTYSNELHLWYAKDKQRSLEKEIIQLLFKANL